MQEGDFVSILNDTDDFITVNKNDHLCQVRRAQSFDPAKQSSSYKSPPKVNNISSQQPYSTLVKVDPDGRLSAEEKAMLVSLHQKFDEMFRPVIGRYNDHAGKVRARVNIGKVVPPARKLQAPCYDRKNMMSCKKNLTNLNHRVYSHDRRT